MNTAQAIITPLYDPASTRRDWMTVKDLAEYFKVSEKTVWRWTYERDFPDPIKVGRSLRWDREKVEEHFEQKRTEKYGKKYSNRG